MKIASSSRGFTLVEALVVISIVAVLALVAIPALQSQDATKLDAGAVEVGNVLRYAISEAVRLERYVLVDGSTSGHLRVFFADDTGATTGAMMDPLTKRALDVDGSTGPWAGLGITPRFLQAGMPYNQLLVSPTLQLQAFDSGVNRGALQSGSGVALTLGSASSTVAIDTTAKVTIPQ